MSTVCTSFENLSKDERVKAIELLEGFKSSGIDGLCDLVEGANEKGLAITRRTLSYVAFSVWMRSHEQIRLGASWNQIRQDAQNLYDLSLGRDLI